MKKLLNKLSRKDGFKEILYDNLSIFIIIILFVTIVFAMAAKTVEMGGSVLQKQDQILNDLGGG